MYTRQCETSDPVNKYELNHLSVLETESLFGSLVYTYASRIDIGLYNV